MTRAEDAAQTSRLLMSALAFNALAFLVLVLVAALTGTRLALVVTTGGLAAVTSQVMMRASSGTERGEVFFWSYAASAFCFAVAAGIAIMVAYAGPSDMDAELLVPVAIVGFGIVLALQVGFGVLARRILKLDHLPWGLLPATVVQQDPMRATLLVHSLATSLAVMLGVGGVTLLHYGPPVLDALLALLLAVLLMAFAVYFWLELRRLIAGVPVAPADLQRLTAAIGSAALKTGAIRRVDDIDAEYIGPQSVRVVVRLQFKDGVSASHVSPVLATLRTAAVADWAQVSDVVLAPARSDMVA